MKILFTQDALINAGTERSNLELISRFSEDLEVGVVYFYPRHELKENYFGAGIRLFFLDIPESYHFPLAVSRLVRLIQKEKPDLLISSLWRADIITRMASVLTGVPLIGTLVNDSYSPIAWTDKKGLKYKVVYWLDRLTGGIPIHWIANANALADSHVKTLGLKREKISVVYRGRPVNMPRSVSPQTETSIKHFISYGRLLERKGFQDAIRAFSQVRKTYPDCTLTIFGEGPYRKELEKLIQDLGSNHSVFLPGKIDNPIDALIHGYCPLPASTALSTGTENCQLITANCFLFPSWYEGFSGALVEAMMAGIPIIASDIPMNLEAIESNKTALVFPVGKPEVLAEQMIKAIENPQLMHGLGHQARLVASQKFDIELIARQYEETLCKIYQQLKPNRV